MTKLRGVLPARTERQPDTNVIRPDECPFGRVLAGYVRAGTGSTCLPAGRYLLVMHCI